ncbi:unnamed protein product, partial [Meganyctiphanes norvegica]
MNCTMILWGVITSATFTLLYFPLEVYSASTAASPCPDPEDISPCTCSIFSETEEHMDCSNVEDETELARVFQSMIPFPYFNSLTIRDNPNIKTLPSHVFGVVTFEMVRIWNTSLEVVEEEAFSDMAVTLRVLELGNNTINSFPFHTLNSYGVLEKINLWDNYIGPDVPIISSVSLKDLVLSNNPFTVLPDDPFANIPNIEHISLNHLQLGQLPTGMFNSLTELRTVQFVDTGLQAIESGRFNMVSPHLQQIHLADNGIADCQDNAFIIPTGLPFMDVIMENNALTVFEEAVWRPLLEANSTLLLAGS